MVFIELTEPDCVSIYLKYEDIIFMRRKGYETEIKLETYKDVLDLIVTETPEEIIMEGKSKEKKEWDERRPYREIEEDENQIALDDYLDEIERRNKQGGGDATET